jgi:soluble lytic murein transglycosylase-like protein
VTASGPFWVAAIAFVFILLQAAPASGQVASYVDKDGKRIYVNVPPPPPKQPPKAAAKPPEVAKGAGERTQPPPAASAPVVAPQRPHKEKLERMVKETAERHKVDPDLVRAVVNVESGWNPFAVSRKGAFGLMQLIPGTARRMGVNDVFDPQQNLDGGVRYLHSLLERYNGSLPLALAAYNAGEGAVDRFRGVPNYRETRHYVQKVTNSYFRPGSDESSFARITTRTMRRIVDERGRVVYTNE